MKLEPKKIGGNLPRDHELDWLPTEPPIDERPFADSASDLAGGLDVVEIPADDPRSMSFDAQMARELGVQARRDGLSPSASPFEPDSVLGLCWIDGYRSGA
jgi:hypothetical protein